MVNPEEAVEVNRFTQEDGVRVYETRQYIHPEYGLLEVSLNLREVDGDPEPRFRELLESEVRSLETRPLDEDIVGEDE